MFLLLAPKLFCWILSFMILSKIFIFIKGFFIFSRYALNHPVVSYCQGMSDLASPLLVTMNDEAHAYICFCSLMSRLSPNFLLDGITMTQRFQHLAEGLMYYDNTFYNYLKSHQVNLLNILKVEQFKRNQNHGQQGL